MFMISKINGIEDGKRVVTGYAVYNVIGDEDYDEGWALAVFDSLSDAMELVHYLNGGNSNILKRFDF